MWECWKFDNSNYYITFAVTLFLSNNPLIKFSPLHVTKACCFPLFESVNFQFFFLIRIPTFIIIMSRGQHGYPWPSPTIRLYRPSLLVGLQGYIMYQHKAVVYRFWWSSGLCLSMWRGPQEYVTYELVPISPAVSRMSGSSDFDSFREWVVSGRTASALWGAASWTCLILLAAFLCNCRQASSPYV